MSINGQTRAAYPPCYMVAFDHRDSLERALARLGVEAAAQQTAGIKLMIWQGVEVALSSLPEHAEAAILIDRGHHRITAAAAAAGVAVAIALEASGRRTLQPEAAPGQMVEELSKLSGGFGKVLLRWHPADHASKKRQQLGVLHELDELVRRAGARLLLELLIPPTPAEASGAGPGGLWEETRLPRHQHDAAEEILGSGVAPALWKIEGHPNTAAARSLAGLVGSQEPEARIVVLGGGADIADLGRVFECSAGAERFSGFAVGRSIWWNPVADYWRGRIPAAEARRAIGRNFLAVIDAYEAAARTPAPTAPS